MSTPSVSFNAARDPLPDGVTLVEASAGTGKTHAITRLVVRLLLERRVEALPQIAVVTYTTAAAAELSGRIRETLAKALEAAMRIEAGQAPADPEDDLHQIVARAGSDAVRLLRDALARCDELAVSTIHGFCLRVLEGNAFESRLNLASEFLTEDDSLLDQATADAWRARLYSDPLLAAATVAMKRSLASTRREVDDLRRRPQVRVVPTATTVTAATAALHKGLSEAAALYTNEVSELLRNGAWLKNDAVNEFGVEALAKTAAHIDDADGHALAAARVLAQEVITSSHKKKPIAPSHPFFVACGTVANALVALDDALRAELTSDALARFDRAKRDGHLLAFDDLLTRLRDGVSDALGGETLAAAVRAQWPVALVDEFQDTDPVQCEIVQRCWPNGQLWLIGDPKQAIYAFRGADLHAYLAAAGKADRRTSLSTNWRSTADLVAAVNHCFAHADPFLDPRIAYHPVTAAGKADATPLQRTADNHAALTWWLAESDADILAHLVVDIVNDLASARLGERTLLAGDCAVLVRTNSQAQIVRAALTAAGVPAVTGGGGDVFTSREARDLATVLAAVLEPGSPRRLRAACATRLIGYDAATVAGLAANDEAWLTMAEQFDAWHRCLRDDGIHALLETWLDGEGWAERLLAQSGGERGVTNLRHLAELLHEAASEQHRSPRNLLAWLDRAQHPDAGIPRERRELRLESDADAVQILTVHRAKGLEFPIVYCPHLSNGVRKRTPAAAHDDDGGTVMSWRPEADLLARARSEELAEDLRLAYVALTRASHRCVIGVSTSLRSAFGALGWLLCARSGGSPEDLDACTGQMLAAAITALAEGCEHHHVVALSPASDVISTRHQVEPPPTPPLRTLRLSAGRLSPLRTASFTGLVHHAERERDHADPGLPTATAKTGLDALPAGARVGTVLHHVLETVDWQQPITLAMVQSYLERGGIVAEAGVSELAQALDRFRNDAWPESGLVLAELPRHARWCEWSFHLPSSGIDGRVLADLCERFGGERERAYAPLLRQLAPQAMAGFLTGSIDLLAEHDGRYWIADWKSNRLGAYDDATMTAAMHTHHYILQALLYTVALHRHLRCRLRDYDPARHLGGAAYVFLRGLSIPGGGMWTFSPQPALITALDTAFVAPAVEKPS